MNLIETDSPEELARRGAQRLVELTREKPAPIHVALSGGSTPKAMYCILTDMPEFDRELAAKIHWWFGDERSVPHSHDDSNVKLANDLLLEPMEVSAQNVHAPDGGAAGLQAEAQRYEDEILATVPKNNDGFPRFDLVYLGMGDDGHTASLFPGTEALTEEKHFFVANHVPQKDTWRLTLTYPAIEAADEILVMAGGANKAPVMIEIFSDAIRETPYPIERILRPENNTTFLTEPSALAEFTQQQRASYLTH